MNFKSIRFRLTIWYSLALAAGLLLFALATWISLRHSLLKDLRRTLVDRVQASQSFLAAESADPKIDIREELDEYSHGFPHGSYLHVTNPEGTVVFTSAKTFPWPTESLSQSEPYATRWRGLPYLMLSRETPIHGRLWRITVAASLMETEQLLNRLRFLLLTLLPGVIVIAAVGGLWLSRRALRPVNEITRAAQMIGAANLSERLPVPATGDELQWLAETWNSMLARLEESMKRLSRFTADASHELRTPVAVIRTTAELAARRNRTADSYRQALQQIALESERMTTLVEDLLLLARTDLEAIEMPKRVFDLGLIVRDICSQMNPVAEEKSIQLTVRDTDGSHDLLGNEAAIRRLVLLLLDNAIKYSNTGGEVKVALENQGSKILLQIIDSGPGINGDELPHIFERFYRGQRLSSQKNEGNGLGLALAASIARDHAASIEVTSPAGGGSIFSVLFDHSRSAS